MAGINDEVLHSGISKNTPGNIMFGAGTFHKGLKYGEHYAPTTDTYKHPDKTYYTISGGSSGGVSYTETTDESFIQNKTYFEKYTGWNLISTVIGATSGGTKLSIIPEFSDVEVDGATVKVKGLAVKTGETAKVEANIIEVTPEILKMMVVGALNTGREISSRYTEIISNQKISEGDYIENLGFVGKTLDGRDIVVIFEYALCTSGLEIEGKNKEATVIKATFECYADLTNNPVTLPYHIYYPKTI